MAPKQRWMVFAVGFLIGSCIASYFLMTRLSKSKLQEDPQSVAEIEAQVVPRIFQAYAERRVPMESRFIMDEKVVAIDADHYQRTLILQGEREAQIVRIVETVQKGHGQFADTVQDWRIMAARRVIVQVKPEVTSPDFSRAIRQSGYRLLAERNAPNVYVIGLPDHRVESVDIAIDYFQGLVDWVIEATPDYLDESLRQ